MRPLLRGVLAGAVGTTAMSLSEAAHHLLRRNVERPIDYDVSPAVPIAAARVLRVRLQTTKQARALFLLAHGGYGSAFGLARELLEVTPIPARWRTPAFFVATEGLALVLFPVLGGTPPPWRWRGELLLASVVQHAVYAAAVGAARKGLHVRSMQARDGLDSRE